MSINVKEPCWENIFDTQRGQNLSFLVCCPSASIMIITPTLSFTLNFLRFMAALIVVIGHMNMLEFSDLGREVGKYGHSMVILFFVISGYIIGRTTLDQKPDAKTYLINRASRIYVVALPSLMLCFAAILLIPGIEGANVQVTAGAHIALALESIFFLNQSWGGFQNPPLNPPFWSLCYEVWYYIIFAAFYYPSSNKNKFLLGGLSCLLAGPAILALMPAWLCGLALVHLKAGLIKKPWIVLSSAVIAITLIVELQLDITTKDHLATFVPTLWRIGYSTRFITDYVLAICFSAILLSVGSLEISISTAVNRGLVNLAGFSFTLYLFHDPILRILQELSGWKQVDHPTHFMVFTFVVALCWLISRGTEAKTSAFRNMLKILVVGSLSKPISDPSSKHISH